MSPCDRFTHRFTDKLLQHPVQFVPHLVHVLLHVVLGVVPLLLQLVLHDHLTLQRQQNTSWNQWTTLLTGGVCDAEKRFHLVFHKQVEHVVGQLPLRAVFNGKLQNFSFDFSLFGLRGLVGLLLTLALLCARL